MTPQEMERNIVRYGDLKPCKTAFIDAHTPGSDQKENFTIIGGGVSESPDQYVHIKETPGFNIGAAGQPPKCRNSLHSTELPKYSSFSRGVGVFSGDAGETLARVVLEEGDIFNIPTGIFRGFENIGNDYGMIMAILGGDDAGGGVIWAPQVIEDAGDHGLVLSDKGRLYDTKKGEKLPDGGKPMPLLTEEELKAFPEPSSMEVIGGYVRRYWDMVAISDKKPAKVIGEKGIIRDKPGFEVGFISRGSASDKKHSHDRPSVFIPVKGYWRVAWDGGTATLAPGDTMCIPAGLDHSAVPSMTGEAALYHVVATGENAGPTWKPN